MPLLSPKASSKLIWLISLLEVKTQIYQVILGKAIYLKLFVTPAKCIVPHNLLFMKDLSCQIFTECSNKNIQFVKDPMQIQFESKYFNLLKYFYFFLLEKEPNLISCAYSHPHSALNLLYIVFL